MVTDTVTMQQFIERNGISLTAEQVDANPSMNDFQGDHWKVTLSREFEGIARYTNRKTGETKPRRYKLRMTTYFSKGHGHHGAEPAADEVLDCLASDASSYDNANGFEDFCSEFGYDSDSRKAEKTYRACGHGAARLKKFLGDDLYQALLYGTERM